MTTVGSNPADQGRISKPHLQRLLFKAGSKRASGLVYEELRGVTAIFVENLAAKAAVLAEHARRATIQAEDIKQALQMMGKKVYSTGQEAQLKRCTAYKPPAAAPGGKKRNPGDRALQAMKHAQAQSECQYIPRAVFERLVRKYSKRWSAEAVGLTQVVTETYLVELLGDAVLAALHAGRVSVSVKDIQLVRRIRKD